MTHCLRFLLAAAFLALQSLPIFAQPQWELLAGPEGGAIRSMATARDGRIYTTVDRKGLFSSIDGGALWTRTPTPDLGGDDYGRIHVTSAGSLLLIRHQAPPLRSTDDGATWMPIDAALDWMTPLATDSSGGIVGSGGRELLRSTDDGASWNRLGEPFAWDITTVAVAPDGALVLGLLPSGGAVGVSTDMGITWQVELLDDDQSAAPISLAFLPDGGILAGGFGGIFLSEDRGLTWSQQHRVEQRRYSQFLRTLDGELVVVTSDGLFLVSAAGSTLTPYGAPTGTLAVSAITLLPGGRPLIGTYDAGMYVGEGARWRRSSRGLPPAAIGALVASTDRALYAIGWSTRFYASTDNGTTWSEPNEQALSQPLLAVDADGMLFSAPYPQPSTGVTRSTDRGATWSPIGDSIAPEVVVSLHVAHDGRIFAGVDRGEESFFSSETDGLFLSTDRGATWRTIGAGMERRTARSITELADGTLFLASSHDVMRLDAGDGFWRDASNGLDTREHINAMVSDAQDRLFTATQHGLFRSLDRGESWQMIATDVADSSFRSLLVTGTGRIVASTSSQGVWTSDDGGETWSLLGGASSPLAIERLVVDAAGVLFAVNPMVGIYRLDAATAAPDETERALDRLDLTAR